MQQRPAGCNNALTMDEPTNSKETGVMQESSSGVTTTQNSSKTSPLDQPDNQNQSTEEEINAPLTENETSDAIDDSTVNIPSHISSHSSVCLPFSEMPTYTPFFANLDRLLHTQNPRPSKDVSKQDSLPHPVTVMEAVSSIPSKMCPTVSNNTPESSPFSCSYLVSRGTTADVQVREDTKEVSELDSDFLLREIASSKQTEVIKTTFKKGRKRNAQSKVMSAGFNLVARIPSLKAARLLNGHPTTLMTKFMGTSSDHALAQMQGQFIPCVLKHRTSGHRKYYNSDREYSCSKKNAAESNKTPALEVKDVLTSESGVSLPANAQASITPYSLEHKGKNPNKKNPDQELSSRQVTRRVSSNSPVPSDDSASSLSVSASMLLLFLCPCLLLFLALFCTLYKLSSDFLWLILWYLFKMVSYPFKVMWRIVNYCRSFFSSSHEETRAPPNTKPLPPKRDDQNLTCEATTTESFPDQFTPPETEDSPPTIMDSHKEEEDQQSIKCREAYVEQDNEILEYSDKREYLDKSTNSIVSKPGLSPLKFFTIFYPCFYVFIVLFYHICKALSASMKRLHMFVLSNLPGVNTVAHILHSVPGYTRLITSRT